MAGRGAAAGAVDAPGAAGGAGGGAGGRVVRPTMNQTCNWGELVQDNPAVKLNSTGHRNGDKPGYADSAEFVYVHPKEGEVGSKIKRTDVVHTDVQKCNSMPAEHHAAIALSIQIAGCLGRNLPSVLESYDGTLDHSDVRVKDHYEAAHQYAADTIISLGVYEGVDIEVVRKLFGDWLFWFHLAEFPLAMTSVVKRILIVDAQKVYPSEHSRPLNTQIMATLFYPAEYFKDNLSKDLDQRDVMLAHLASVFYSSVDGVGKGLDRYRGNYLIMNMLVHHEMVIRTCKGMWDYVSLHGENVVPEEIKLRPMRCIEKFNKLFELYPQNETKFWELLLTMIPPVGETAVSTEHCTHLTLMSQSYHKDPAKFIEELNDASPDVKNEVSLRVRQVRRVQMGKTSNTLILVLTKLNTEGHTEKAENNASDKDEKARSDSQLRDLIAKVHEGDNSWKEGVLHEDCRREIETWLHENVKRSDNGGPIGYPVDALSHSSYRGTQITQVLMTNTDVQSKGVRGGEWRTSLQSDDPDNFGECEAIVAVGNPKLGTFTAPAYVYAKRGSRRGLTYQQAVNKFDISQGAFSVHMRSNHPAVLYAILGELCQYQGHQKDANGSPIYDGVEFGSMSCPTWIKLKGVGRPDSPVALPWLMALVGASQGILFMQVEKACLFQQSRAIVKDTLNHCYDAVNRIDGEKSLYTIFAVQRQWFRMRERHDYAMSCEDYQHDPEKWTDEPPVRYLTADGVWTETSKDFTFKDFIGMVNEVMVPTEATPNADVRRDNAFKVIVMLCCFGYPWHDHKDFLPAVSAFIHVLVKDVFNREHDKQFADRMESYVQEFLMSTGPMTPGTVRNRQLIGGIVGEARGLHALNAGILHCSDELLDELNDRLNVPETYKFLRTGCVEHISSAEFARLQAAKEAGNYNKISALSKQELADEEVELEKRNRAETRQDMTDSADKPKRMTKKAKEDHEAYEPDSESDDDGDDKPARRKRPKKTGSKKRSKKTGSSSKKDDDDGSGGAGGAGDGDAAGGAGDGDAAGGAGGGDGSGGAGDGDAADPKGESTDQSERVDDGVDGKDDSSDGDEDQAENEQEDDDGDGKGGAEDVSSANPETTAKFSDTPRRLNRRGRDAAAEDNDLTEESKGKTQKTKVPRAPRVNLGGRGGSVRGPGGRFVKKGDLPKPRR